MFCPKCGWAAEHDSKFCSHCGANLKELTESIPVKTVHHGLSWGTIVFGILIIVAIYLIPMFPSKSLLGSQNLVTLSKAMDLCNSPLGSCNGFSIQLWFYSFWICGIFFVFIGFISKNK